MNKSRELVLNARVASMQPSATLAMTARAKAARREGRPVVELSAGEPDFGTPAVIAAAAEAAIKEGFTRYTENTGMLPLREAIADKLLRENGIRYDPADIVCSNGAKQSVALAVAVLTGPGDEVLIPAPYWVSYPEMVRFAGAEPVFMPTSVEDGYKITAPALEAAITDRTRMIILCSPSNPTGAMYGREELEALAAVLRRHDGVFVVSDEIYEYIRYGVEHVSIGSLPGMRERTITVNGFSKAYAMTGWRLGYLAADRPIANATAMLQSQLTSAPSSISQKAGIAALKMDPEPIARMVSAFRARRDFIIGQLRDIEGLRCPCPDGAFYVFPAVSHYYGLSSPGGMRIGSAEDLCFFLLEEYDLALVPGLAFGDPDGLRISYAASMEDLEEAMRRMRLALGSLS